MKKLLLSLLVLATLASCGKDNNVSTSGSSGLYTDPLTNPNLSGNYYTNKALADAKMAITNYQTYFGTMYLRTSSGSTANCKEKWFGTWCTYKQTTNSSGYTLFNHYTAQNPNIAYIFSDGNYVVHSNVDIAAKQNEISNIFASATALSYTDYSDGRIFYVRVNNDYYEINTRYPIQANPVRVNSRILMNIQ